MTMTFLSGALAPIDRQITLGEQAYRTLKDSIIGGAFVAGQKLTVRGVAEALGVSTTPARDAVNRLINEGAMIYLGPKTVIVPALTQAALEEVTEIRLALEGLAAEKGAAGIDGNDIRKLEQFQAKINRGLDESDYLQVLRVNKDFHFLIYKRASLPRLVCMIESLWLRTGPSLHKIYSDFVITRQGVSNHEAALKALRRGDAGKVRAAIEKDIRDGYAMLSRALKHQAALETAKARASGNRP